MSKKLFLIVAFVLVLSVGMAFSDGQNGTTLKDAEVSITPHWTITYGWTIDKSVSPVSWDLFTGDDGTSKYTIAVTKDDGTEEAWVEGQISVKNDGEEATENLAIVAVLQDGYGSPNDFLADATVDVSGNPVLDPGETGTYSYRVNIPITGGTYPQPHAGGTYKVTADITITNHSGHLGELFGPSPSATTVFPSSATLVNTTIHVDDANGGSWEFSASGSESYEKTFTCDGDDGTQDNTATIRETGQSASASVTVNCYALETTKDACTSLTRTYDWTIDKSADQSSLDPISVGQTFTDVGYSVKVDATYTDGDWGVSGSITVHNPAPMAATINNISDVVSGVGAAAVDFGVTFPYTLAAGGDLTGTYSASLPDAASRTNTATSTLQNYSYDKDGNATAGGTTNFSGTADVDFGTATLTEVDECIDISDTYAGALGTVCFDDAPKTFTYSRNIGPYDVCGDYTVENTASFVTNDGGVTDSDSWTITVHVPCEGGCTLTPGYWKTHSKYGPAPYDDNWATLGDKDLDDNFEHEDESFFYSGQTYYQVLWTAPKGGNAYYILAHSYIAAALNFLNGADPTTAQVAFNAATALFSSPTNTPAYLGNLKGSKRQQWIDLATTLDNYNNGLIGPGHCDENGSVNSVSKPDASSESDFENLFMETSTPVPTEYSLSQNHPNPFNPSTMFTFDIPKETWVKLTIYNISGQRVASVVNEYLNAGHYTYNWQMPVNLPSGTYIYRLETADFTSTKHMLFMK